MKVQSTFYIDFISKTVDVILISSFITKQMPKLLIFDAFTLLICKKNVAIYALLRCKIFSLKIWLCKIFDKFHVCMIATQPSHQTHFDYSDIQIIISNSALKCHLAAAFCFMVEIYYIVSKTLLLPSHVYTPKGT